MTGEHYFSPTPAAPARPAQVRFTARGREFSLVSAGGTFSAGRLDPGTAVLLRKVEPPGGRGAVVLDLGCGYGPITAVLATSSPTVTVYAVDVNTRALALARTNADALGVSDRVVTATPDEVPAGLCFDEIWSNPPIRIGKPALHDLLLRWLPRLGPDGIAWLVVARHLGADSLADWLDGQGWPAARHAAQKGYRVLAVSRAAPAPAGPAPASPETA